MAGEWVSQLGVKPPSWQENRFASSSCLWRQGGQVIQPPRRVTRLGVDSAQAAASVLLTTPMKLPRCFSALLLLALLVVPVTRAAEANERVFELRTYTTEAGRLPALLARFRDHTVKLFEKHGMKNVGYWTPADAKDGAENKLIYLLEHRSREAATAAWKAFGADPEWQAARAKSEASGKIVSKVEFLFLAPTDFAKPMEAGNGSGAARSFELRTYRAPEGKLADLDARFRNHTVTLFTKHGMTNLGYFHPTDAAKGASTTLVYFLAYPSREAAAVAWKAFRDDPNWVKARTESEKNGKLTAQVDSVYLVPVDFSRIR